MGLLKLVNDIKKYRESINASCDKIIKEKLKLQYYKRCYEVCKLLDWNMKELANYETELEITASTVKHFAKKYATQVLGISDDELKNEIYNATIAKKNDFKEHDYICERYDNFFERLSLTVSEEETIRLIDDAISKKEVSLISLRDAVADFVIYNHPDKKNTLIVDLENKINVYKQHIGYRVFKKKDNSEPKKREKILEQERLLNQAVNVIGEFIASDSKNTEDFCLDRDISIDYFNCLLVTCKDKNVVLYRKFLDELVRRGNSINENAVELIKRLSHFTRNGIEDNNGELRKFDVIDFYLFTGMKYEDFLRILLTGAGVLPVALSPARQKNIRDYFILNDFKYRDNSLVIKDILEDKIRLGYISSENSEMSYYQVSIGERQCIIDYLNNNNNMPVNKYSYLNALERYVKGVLLDRNADENNIYTRRLKKD